MDEVNQISNKLRSYITKANKNARVIKLNLSDLDIFNHTMDTNAVYTNISDNNQTSMCY